MSPIKWLNNLLFMEKLTGIYRNYCIQQKIKKYFIIFQIFVQTTLYTILVLNELYLLLERDDYSQHKIMFAIFRAFACVNSVLCVVTGICYSRDFMSYYRSISRASEWFKDNKQLINSLKKVFCIGITFNCMFFSLSVFKTAQAFIKFLPSHPKLNLVPILVSQAVIRYTIVFQNLMLYIIAMIVVHLFKCFTSLISAVHERVKNCDISSDEQCDITREQIQGWVELYRDLANSCDKVSLCFGRQYLFSLVFSVLQYILFTYHLFYKNILKFEDSDDCTNFLIIIFSSLTVTIMPLSAGQMASNQGLKFHRALVRLYNRMIIDSDEAEAKLIKDFIRLVRKKPIEIKLLPKTRVGMYMLPVLLALSTNYIIVMLQFNHVI